MRTLALILLSVLASLYGQSVVTVNPPPVSSTTVGGDVSGTVGNITVNKFGGQSLPASGRIAYSTGSYLSGDAGLTYTANSGSLGLSAGTITVSQPAVNATQTWNAAGITFSGLFENITDTASAAGSLLLNLQKNSVSIFTVDKNGNFNTPGNVQCSGTGSLLLAGGLIEATGCALKYQVTAGNITLTTLNYYVSCSAATTTVTLPTSGIYTGQEYIIQATNAAPTITISGTVDGVVNPTITTQYGLKRVMFNGTNYSSW